MTFPATWLVVTRSAVSSPAGTDANLNDLQCPLKGTAPGRSHPQVTLASVQPAPACHQAVALQRRHITRQRRADHDEALGHRLTVRSSLRERATRSLNCVTWSPLGSRIWS
jgi:hypothetical protein